MSTDVGSASSVAGTGGGAGDAGSSSEMRGGTAGAGGPIDACAAEPERTAATAQNVGPGDDFLAASTTGVLGLVGMFDNAGGRFTSGPRWAWASGVEAALTAYQRTGGEQFPNLFVATFDLNRAGNFIDDFGVRWLAASAAPEVVVSDVSLDGEVSIAAASLERDCGRLDASEELLSDRHHEQAECVLGRAPGVALAAGPQQAWFELGVDDFWSKDGRLADLSVVATGGETVASRTLQRSDFKDARLHAFNVDFMAAASARYDFVVKRLAPADAPRLRLRAIYARPVATEQQLTLPFDVRAVGNAAADGDADGSGTAFAAEALARLVWPNASFKLGPLMEPGKNALTSAGQALPLSAASARALHVLLLASGGAQPDNVFTVDYAQGAPQTFTRSLSDWLSPELLPEENLAVRAPFVWTKTAKSYGAWHAVELTFPLDRARAPTQLTLPKNAHLKILGITVTE